MPQVKESLLTKLVKKAINEVELTAGSDNTKFNIKVLVSNPQSETKLGIRIQLKPKIGFIEPDKKGELEAAIMKKFNNSLEQFNIQISKDTDVPDPEILGFFIPLPQLKNMIISALGISTEDSEDTVTKPPINKNKADDLPPKDKALDKKPMNEAMRQRTLNEISSMVIKEDFYGFINAGNNILRSLEERFDIREAKKYLEYLVKNNIM
tara:strand:+ start:303 stop:929 length:627 start_codon:yes stop_codon:yes gene_type:complete